MTVVAGLFLTLFGALGAWLIGSRFPTARFTRNGYAAMAVGGALFSAWAFSHSMAVGIAAMALLLIGGVLGAIGAFRRELRLT